MLLVDPFGVNDEERMSKDPPATNIPSHVVDTPVGMNQCFSGEERQSPVLRGANLDQSLGTFSEQNDDADALISSAMCQLSLEDRERALHEMHGVSEFRPERPDFVDLKVTELHQELYSLTRQLNCSYVTAFKIAESQNAEFAYNRVACERFLRASEFDVKKAATTMLKYYEWKLQLWGERRLTRDIELDDLDEHDIEVLKKGYFQVLPERDRAGRPVVVSVFNNQTFPSADCAGRVLWYTFQLRTDQYSETIVVSVILYLAEPSLASMDPALMQTYSKALTLIPMKKAAYHHCINDSASVLFKTFLNHVLIPMDRANKAKTIVHSGSATECNYELMTFGIPPHMIPVNEDGKIKVKNHLEYLQGRKTRERFAKVGKTDMVSIPFRSDILLGRGKPIQQAPGNLRLAAIVDSYVLEYHQLTNKQDKTALAAQVVRMVKAASARFVSKESGLWMEVPDDVAREKVSGLFRTLYRTRYSDVKAAAEKEIGKGKSSRATLSPSDKDDIHDNKRLKRVGNRAA